MLNRKKKASNDSRSKTSSSTGAPVAVKSKRASRKNRSNRSGRPNDGVLMIPAASGSVSVTSCPAISNLVGGDARVLIRHREFIGDVKGSTGFASVKYSINPGLDETFPWLSEVGNNYESYRFRRLVFEYSTIKGSTAAGSFMMYIAFDASDGGPTDKIEAFSHQGAVKGPTWAPNIVLDASRANLEKFGTQRFIRSALKAGTDIKTYDVGNLWLCTSGQADTSAMGELYVTYELELMTPQMHTSDPSDTASSVTSGGTVTPAAPFGSVPVVNSISENVSVEPTPAAGSKFTFYDIGDYLMEVVMAGTGAVVGPVGFDNPYGMTVTTKVAQQAIATGASSLGSYLVHATTSPAVVYVTAAAVMTTVTQAIARITPYRQTLA